MPKPDNKRQKQGRPSDPRATVFQEQFAPKMPGSGQREVFIRPSPEIKDTPSQISFGNMVQAPDAGLQNLAAIAQGITKGAQAAQQVYKFRIDKGKRDLEEIRQQNDWAKVVYKPQTDEDGNVTQAENQIINRKDKEYQAKVNEYEAARKLTLNPENENYDPDALTELGYTIVDDPNATYIAMRDAFEGTYGGRPKEVRLYGNRLLEQYDDKAYQADQKDQTRDLIREASLIRDPNDRKVFLETWRDTNGAYPGTLTGDEWARLYASTSNSVDSSNESMIQDKLAEAIDKEIQDAVGKGTELELDPARVDELFDPIVEEVLNNRDEKTGQLIPPSPEDLKRLYKLDEIREAAKRKMRTVKRRKESDNNKTNMVEGDQRSDKNFESKTPAARYRGLPERLDVLAERRARTGDITPAKEAQRRAEDTVEIYGGLIKEFAADPKKLLEFAKEMKIYDAENTNPSQLLERVKLLFTQELKGAKFTPQIREDVLSEEAAQLGAERNAVIQSGALTSGNKDAVEEAMEEIGEIETRLDLIKNNPDQAFQEMQRSFLAKYPAFDDDFTYMEQALDGVFDSADVEAITTELSTLLVADVVEMAMPRLAEASIDNNTIDITEGDVSLLPFAIQSKTEDLSIFDENEPLKDAALYAAQNVGSDEVDENGNTPIEAFYQEYEKTGGSRNDVRAQEALEAAGEYVDRFLDARQRVVTAQAQERRGQLKKEKDEGEIRQALGSPLDISKGTNPSGGNTDQAHAQLFERGVGDMYNAVHQNIATGNVPSILSNHPVVVAFQNDPKFSQGVARGDITVDDAIGKLLKDGILTDPSDTQEAREMLNLLSMDYARTNGLDFSIPTTPGARAVSMELAIQGLLMTDPQNGNRYTIPVGDKDVDVPFRVTGGFAQKLQDAIAAYQAVDIDSDQSVEERVLDMNRYKVELAIRHNRASRLRDGKQDPEMVVAQSITGQADYLRSKPAKSFFKNQLGMSDTEIASLQLVGTLFPNLDSNVLANMTTGDRTFIMNMMEALDRGGSNTHLFAESPEYKKANEQLQPWFDSQSKLLAENEDALDPVQTLKGLINWVTKQRGTDSDDPFSVTTGMFATELEDQELQDALLSHLPASLHDAPLTEQANYVLRLTLVNNTFDGVNIWAGARAVVDNTRNGLTRAEIPTDALLRVALAPLNLSDGRRMTFNSAGQGIAVSEFVPQPAEFDFNTGGSAKADLNDTLLVQSVTNMDFIYNYLRANGDLTPEQRSAAVEAAQSFMEPLFTEANNSAQPVDLMGAILAAEYSISQASGEPSKIIQSLLENNPMLSPEDLEALRSEGRVPLEFSTFLELSSAAYLPSRYAEGSLAKDAKQLGVGQTPEGIELLTLINEDPFSLAPNQQEVSIFGNRRVLTLGGADGSYLSTNSNTLPYQLAHTSNEIRRGGMADASDLPHLVTSPTSGFKVPISDFKDDPEQLQVILERHEAGFRGALLKGLHARGHIKLMPDGTLDPTFGVQKIGEVDGERVDFELSLAQIQQPLMIQTELLKYYLTPKESRGIRYPDANWIMDTINTEVYGTSGSNDRNLFFKLWGLREDTRTELRPESQYFSRRLSDLYQPIEYDGYYLENESFFGLSAQLGGGTVADLFRGAEVAASHTMIGRALQGITREEGEIYRKYAADMAGRRPVMRLQSDRSLTNMPFQSIRDVHKLTAKSISSNGGELIGDIDATQFNYPFIGKRIDPQERRIDIPPTEEEKAEDEEFRQSLNRAFTPTRGS
tara:strand:- start:15902 stop:21148 length:5247 start_codon:yes stop_codon:yes gene_type:complete